QVLHRADPLANAHRLHCAASLPLIALAVVPLGQPGGARENSRAAGDGAHQALAPVAIAPARKNAGDQLEARTAVVDLGVGRQERRAPTDQAIIGRKRGRLDRRGRDLSLHAESLEVCQTHTRNRGGTSRDVRESFPQAILAVPRGAVNAPTAAWLANGGQSSTLTDRQLRSPRLFRLAAPRPCRFRSPTSGSSLSKAACSIPSSADNSRRNTAASRAPRRPAMRASWRNGLPAAAC